MSVWQSASQHSAARQANSFAPNILRTLAEKLFVSSTRLVFQAPFLRVSKSVNAAALIGGLLLFGVCGFRRIIHPDWSGLQALATFWPLYLTGGAPILFWLAGLPRVRTTARLDLAPTRPDRSLGKIIADYWRRLSRVAPAIGVGAIMSFQSCVAVHSMGVHKLSTILIIALSAVATLGLLLLTLTEMN
jgi:hypothetical protein